MESASDLPAMKTVGIKLNYTPIITADGGVDAKIHAEVKYTDYGFGNESL